MTTLYMLHRPREVERYFRSPEALVSSVISPAAPGHFDQQSRMVAALKSEPAEHWIRLDEHTMAQRFIGDPGDFQIEG